jgi:phosphoribosylanthranilate isomerase
MVRVKICGITNTDDALAAVHFGADALGFVFATSPRQVTPAQVSRIVGALHLQGRCLRGQQYRRS